MVETAAAAAGPVRFRLLQGGAKRRRRPLTTESRSFWYFDGGGGDDEEDRVSAARNNNGGVEVVSDEEDVDSDHDVGDSSPTPKLFAGVEVKEAQEPPLKKNRVARASIVLRDEGFRVRSVDERPAAPYGIKWVAKKGEDEEREAVAFHGEKVSRRRLLPARKKKSGAVHPLLAGRPGRGAIPSGGGTAARWSESSESEEEEEVLCPYGAASSRAMFSALDRGEVPAPLERYCEGDMDVEIADRRAGSKTRRVVRVSLCDEARARKIAETAATDLEEEEEVELDCVQSLRDAFDACDVEDSEVLEARGRQGVEAQRAADRAKRAAFEARFCAAERDAQRQVANAAPLRKDDGEGYYFFPSSAYRVMHRRGDEQRPSDIAPAPAAVAAAGPSAVAVLSLRASSIVDDANADAAARKTARKVAATMRLEREIQRRRFDPKIQLPGEQLKESRRDLVQRLVANRAVPALHTHGGPGCDYDYSPPPPEPPRLAGEGPIEFVDPPIVPPSIPHIYDDDDDDDDAIDVVVAPDHFPSEEDCAIRLKAFHEIVAPFHRDLERRSKNDDDDEVDDSDGGLWESGAVDKTDIPAVLERLLEDHPNSSKKEKSLEEYDSDFLLERDAFFSDPPRVLPHPFRNRPQLGERPPPAPDVQPTPLDSPRPPLVVADHRRSRPSRQQPAPLRAQPPPYVLEPPYDTIYPPMRQHHPFHYHHHPLPAQPGNRTRPQPPPLSPSLTPTQYHPHFQPVLAHPQQAPLPKLGAMPPPHVPPPQHHVPPIPIHPAPTTSS